MCRFQKTSILERVCGAINSENQVELAHLSDVLKTNQVMKGELLEELNKKDDWVEFIRISSTFPFILN